MSRSDGREASGLRPVRFHRNWIDQGEGNCLVEFGRTRVLCIASFGPGVPRWRKDSGRGWITAEYAMLPRSTDTRGQRESVKGRLGGRTQEISRLVGRSLRAVVDDKALGENTIHVDCDVLQADGGTRTAAITGAYVALADALAWAREAGHLGGAAGKAEAGSVGGQPAVLLDSVAAVSVGVIESEARLDLHYEEDVRAQTDMNVVMTGSGKYVEVQGTAEGQPFDRALLDQLLELAAAGCARLTTLQREALSATPPPRGMLLDGSPAVVS